MNKNYNTVYSGLEVDAAVARYLRDKELEIRTLFTSFVFARSDSKPEKPRGGSYDNPYPYTPVGVWHDGIPKGNEVVWMSHRTFYSDDYQTKDWSEPTTITDSTNFDVEFSPGYLDLNGNWRYKQLIYPPSHNKAGLEIHGINNPEIEALKRSLGWYDTNEYLETDLFVFMATSSCNNGIWGDWVYTKIKGEQGENGVTPYLLLTSNDSISVSKSATNSALLQIYAYIQIQQGSLLIPINTSSTPHVTIGSSNAITDISNCEVKLLRITDTKYKVYLERKNDDALTEGHIIISAQIISGDSFNLQTVERLILVKITNDMYNLLISPLSIGVSSSGNSFIGNSSISILAYTIDTSTGYTNAVNLDDSKYRVLIYKYDNGNYDDYVKFESIVTDGSIDNKINYDLSILGLPTKTTKYCIVLEEDNNGLWKWCDQEWIDVTPESNQGKPGIPGVSVMPYLLNDNVLIDNNVSNLDLLLASTAYLKVKYNLEDLLSLANVNDILSGLNAWVLISANWRTSNILQLRLTISHTIMDLYTVTSNLSRINSSLTDSLLGDSNLPVYAEIVYTIQVILLDEDHSVDQGNAKLYTLEAVQNIIVKDTGNGEIYTLSASPGSLNVTSIGGSIYPINPPIKFVARKLYKGQSTILTTDQYKLRISFNGYRPDVIYDGTNTSIFTPTDAFNGKYLSLIYRNWGGENDCPNQAPVVYLYTTKDPLVDPLGFDDSESIDLIERGPKGDSNLILELSNPMNFVKVDADGKTINLTTISTDLNLMYGSSYTLFGMMPSIEKVERYDQLGVTTVFTEGNEYSKTIVENEDGYKATIVIPAGVQATDGINIIFIGASKEGYTCRAVLSVSAVPYARVHFELDTIKSIKDQGADIDLLYYGALSLNPERLTRDTIGRFLGYPKVIDVVIKLQYYSKNVIRTSPSGEKITLHNSLLQEKVYDYTGYHTTTLPWVGMQTADPGDHLTLVTSEGTLDGKFDHKLVVSIYDGKDNTLWDSDTIWVVSDGIDGEGTQGPPGPLGNHLLGLKELYTVSTVCPTISSTFKYNSQILSLYFELDDSSCEIENVVYYRDFPNIPNGKSAWGITIFKYGGEGGVNYDLIGPYLVASQTNTSISVTSGIIRSRGEWNSVPNGSTFRDGSGEGDDQFIDVVVYNNKYYKCNIKHTKSSNNYPTSSTDISSSPSLWKVFTEYENVASKVIITDNLLTNLTLTGELIISKDAESCQGILLKTILTPTINDGTDISSLVPDEKNSWGVIANYNPKGGSGDKFYLRLGTSHNLLRLGAGLTVDFSGNSDMNNGILSIANGAITAAFSDRNTGSYGKILADAYSYSSDYNSIKDGLIRTSNFTQTENGFKFKVGEYNSELATTTYVDLKANLISLKIEEPSNINLLKDHLFNSWTRYWSIPILELLERELEYADLSKIIGLKRESQFNTPVFSYDPDSISSSSLDHLQEVYKENGNKIKLLRLNLSDVIQNGILYTLSFYVKMNSVSQAGTYILIDINETISNSSIFSDLSTTISDNTTSSNIILINNKWHRCTMTFTANYLQDDRSNLELTLTSIKNGIPIKNSINGFYFAFPKLEVGNIATNVSKDYNDVNTGLLDTGIDITRRKISLTADQLEVTNNSGDKTLGIDSVGNMEITGTINATGGKFTGPISLKSKDGQLELIIGLNNEEPEISYYIGGLFQWNLVDLTNAVNYVRNQSAQFITIAVSNWYFLGTQIISSNSLNYLEDKSIIDTNSKVIKLLLNSSLSPIAALSDRKYALSVDLLDRSLFSGGALSDRYTIWYFDGPTSGVYSALDGNFVGQYPSALEITEGGPSGIDSYLEHNSVYGAVNQHFKITPFKNDSTPCVVGIRATETSEIEYYNIGRYYRYKNTDKSGTRSVVSKQSSGNYYSTITGYIFFNNGWTEKATIRYTGS